MYYYYYVDTNIILLSQLQYSLRQLDLSLLSQLWSLNESIQDFRQMLQDQDDRILSPPSPSPTPSSGEDGEVDEFYSPMPLRFRPAPPPPPLRRASNSSSGTSSVQFQVILLCTKICLIFSFRNSQKLKSCIFLVFYKL